MTEECKHLISIEFCGVCRPRPGTQEVPEHTGRLGAWFRARFPGECDGCGDDFDEGDLIRADGEGGWLCGGCGNVSRAPELALTREELEAW